MPELTATESMSFIVDSHAIEKDIQEIKADLLEQIRIDLSNFYLQLELVVEIGGHDIQVPYTPTEKFNKLAERHPLLNELKKRLDLELEY